MSEKLILEQGSKEWHEQRAQHACASESGCIMGVNPWHPKTWQQLWEIKQGLKKIEETAPMRYGTEMEPIARAAFESTYQILVEPQVLVDGIYLASMDGIDFDGNIAAEIKCPFRGVDSYLWKAALEKKIPEYYFWQMVHQWKLAQTERHIFFVYCTEGGGQSIAIEKTGEELLKFVPQLEEQWEEFWPYMVKGTPPPPTEKDTLIHTDMKWKKAATAWTKANTKLVAAKAKVEETREALELLAGDCSGSGFGVRATRVHRKGNVNYSKVPQLDGIELDEYRGKGSVSYRIQEQKE